MKKNNKKFIIKLVLVIIWLSIIFNFSNASSITTTNQSLGVSKVLVTLSLNATNKLHITSISLDENNINKIADNIRPFIRKVAHIFEYFILAILVLLMVKETNIKYYYIFTVLFCMIMAFLDEIHQLFIVNRSGNLLDVLIDTSGCLLFILVNKIYNKLKLKKVK